MRGKGIMFGFILIALSVSMVTSVAQGEDVAALNAAIHARGGGWIAGETIISLKW